MFYFLLYYKLVTRFGTRFSTSLCLNFPICETGTRVGNRLWCLNFPASNAEFHLQLPWKEVCGHRDLNTQTLGHPSLTRAERRKKNQNRKLGGSQKNVFQNTEVVLSSNQQGHLLGNLDPCLPGARLLACPLWSPPTPGECAASKNKASLPGRDSGKSKCASQPCWQCVHTASRHLRGVRGQPSGWTCRTPAADDKDH